MYIINIQFFYLLVSHIKYCKLIYILKGTVIDESGLENEKKGILSYENTPTNKPSLSIDVSI